MHLRVSPAPIYVYIAWDMLILVCIIIAALLVHIALLLIGMLMLYRIYNKYRHYHPNYLLIIDNNKLYLSCNNNKINIIINNNYKILSHCIYLECMANKKKIDLIFLRKQIGAQSYARLRRYLVQEFC